MRVPLRRYSLCIGSRDRPGTKLGAHIVRQIVRFGPALLAGSAWAAVGSAPVQAQSVDPEETEPDVIIVTARKQAEELRDIPLSITALTSEDLRRRVIRDLDDVALQTPGLVFEDYANGGFATPIIRGTTQFDITALEQNVSVFIDGLYIPRQYAFDLGTTNLERIEVVKGPQSALYGQNAFAGAINYVTTARPINELSFFGRSGVGTDGLFIANGEANLPILADALAVRVAAGFERFSGSYENNFPVTREFNPGTNGKIGGYENYSVQAGFSAQLFEALRIDGDYYHFDVNSETSPYFRLTRAASDTNCSPGTFFGTPVQNLFCGELPSEPVTGPSGVAGLVIDPRSFGLLANTDIVRVGATLTATEQVTIDYLGGLIDSDVRSASSLDRDPLVPARFGPRTGNIFSFVPSGGFHYTSHEIRATYSGDGGLLVSLGGYVSDGEDVDQGGFGLVEFGGQNSFPEQPAGVTVNRNTVDTLINSVFGRISLPVTDRLTVGAEARYTDEEKVIVDGASGRTFVFKDDFITPRFSMDYEFGVDTLIFASAAKGVKSGGANTTSFAGLSDEERFYGPDKNWTYEVGIKSSLFQTPANISVSAFLIDWSDLQTPSTPTGAPINTPTITTNLGSAESKGVELTADLRLTDFLRLDGTLAYIDATYDEGTISARIARAGICDGVVCAADGDVGGNRLPRSSNWQYSLGASFETALDDSIDVYFRADLLGQSDQYVAEINVAEIEARTLVNLSAGLSRGRFGVSAFVKNLFDRRYVANAFFVANPFQVEYAPTLGRQRQLGLLVSFDY